jgi:hypothetical protein
MWVSWINMKIIIMGALIELESAFTGPACPTISRTMCQLAKPVVSMREVSQRKLYVDMKCQIDPGNV